MSNAALRLDPHPNEDAPELPIVPKEEGMQTNTNRSPKAGAAGSMPRGAR